MLLCLNLCTGIAGCAIFVHQVAALWCCLQLLACKRIQELGVRTAIVLSPCTLHAVRCKDMCCMWTHIYMLVSAGLSSPAQHVDESWQSAEFFATKVGSVCKALNMIQ